MKCSDIAMLAAALLVAQAASNSQPSYTLVNLGERSHLTYSIGSSINIRGQVAGFCGSSRCMWDGTVPTDLGSAGAASINYRGQIVGSIQNPRGYFVGSSLWQGGKMTDLSAYGCAGCDAWAINDRGQVIGTLSGGPSRPHAFLWEYGALNDLGALGEGDSRAYGINNRGQVVGCASSTTGDYAVMWENGKMIDLHVPGRPNCAYGINDRGQVVGTFYPENPSYHSEHVFLWENGRLTNLNPGTEAGARLPQINNRGEVLWNAYSGAGFLWSAGKVTQVSSLLGSPMEPPLLLQAQAFNDRGQMAGALWNGLPSAVRLDPVDLVPWTPDGSAFSTGGWVQDDMYGMRAALFVPPDAVAAGTRLGVEIRVFEDPPNVPIPHVYRPGTFFTDIVPITDARTTLNPTTRGFALHLPLASPLPAGTVLQLLRPHPFTGRLLPVSGISGKWVYGSVNASGSAAEFSEIASVSTPLTTFSTFVGLLPAAILGDVNGDGKVDCTDLGLVKASFGKREGQPGFNRHADLNDDGVVDLNDLVLISRQLPSGTSCKGFDALK